MQRDNNKDGRTRKEKTQWDWADLIMTPLHTSRHHYHHLWMLTETERSSPDYTLVTACTASCQYDTSGAASDENAAKEMNPASMMRNREKEICIYVYI